MGKFSEVILTPHRLTAFIDISKQFLAQDSNDAEAILTHDLASAIAEKLDMTIFGSESGDTYTPAGILQGDYVTDGGALTGVTYNTVLDLESAVEEKNGFDFMFVCNPKVKYALKGTQMASGLQMVWDGNEIDGYKAVVSNSVANKGILCLNPKDLAVATWSGVEILVDNYTQALKNNVRIVVNYLVDAKLRGNRIAGAIFDQQ
jgi:HK97 family phage major capsid protein